MKTILLLVLVGLSLACGGSGTPSEIALEERAAPPGAPLDMEGDVADRTRKIPRPDTSFWAVPVPAQKDVGNRYDIQDAEEVGMIDLEFDEPQPVVAYIAAGFDANPTWQTQVAAGNPPINQNTNVPGQRQELWILGHARVGMQESLIDFFFDVPVGQIVQLAVATSSLKVAARLIVATRVDAGIPADPGLWALKNLTSNPPRTIAPSLGGFAIKSNPAHGPNRVTAIAGKGIGITNATRRCQVIVDAAHPVIVTPMPNYATSVRVVGATTESYLQLPVPTSVVGYGPFAVPDQDEKPLIANIAAIKVSTSTVGPPPDLAEIFWRLGMSGDPAL